MLDITEISTIIATAGVLVGVIYYIQVMRDQAKTRQTDLVMRLYATYSASEFQDAWLGVRKMAQEGDVNGIDGSKNKVLNEVCLFFEGIGILLKRRIVDHTLIEDLFGGAVERAWEYVRKSIYQGRQEFNDPTIYYYFEYLYNEMQKREQAGVKNG